MFVSRRSVLQYAAASALAPMIGFAGAADDAASAKLTLCAPLTHSDWALKPNIAWGPAGVTHMLDACKACGWSRVMWRAFDAGQATYASKLLRPGLCADDDNIFNPRTDEGRAAVKKLLPNLTAEQGAAYLKQMATMDYFQFDSLACAVEYGHSIGLQIHAWATINEDDHGWGWASEFTRAHPQYRWVRRDGRPYHSQLSFAFEQVRQYKLGLIKELLAYNVDGLFIDWIRTGDIRDNPQTDEAGVANSGYESPNIEEFKKRHDADPRSVANDDPRWLAVRAEPQTIFMRDLRKLVREIRDIPVVVMVGHPWHYRGAGDKIDGNLRGLLLDLPAWSAEGLIDAAVPAGYYRDGGDANKAYAALKNEVGDGAHVWYYAWVPNTPAEFERDFLAAQKLGAKKILFWEADYIDSRPNAVALKAAMSAKAQP